LGLFGSFGSVVSPVLPQYAERLGASYMDIGLFFSAYSFTWSILQLYTGYLSDKYGRSRFVMLGLFVYGISLILIGFFQSFMQLVIFRVIQGVGLGLFGPAALGLVAQAREKRARHPLDFYLKNNFKIVKDLGSNIKMAYYL
jgi:MFS family permease